MPEFHDLIKDLRQEISQFTRPAHEVLLDEADAMKMLKVSRRTLANWRQQGVLKHRKLGGKIYYTLKDILDGFERPEESSSSPQARF